MRLVIDSNLFISHLLLPSSAPGEAVRRAFTHHTVLLSEALLIELNTVLSRKKFASYLTAEERMLFLSKLHKICEPVSIVQHIQACRDAKDDMLLELAVNGSAETILSGDKDLLALHPFRKIPILTAAQFLKHHG